jgi:1-pyrroline-5-carboxylate dehydrogenase
MSSHLQSASTSTQATAGLAGGGSNNGVFVPPTPYNEPVLGYAPGSAERAAVKSALQSLTSSTVELSLPACPGAPAGRRQTMTMPHNHQHVLGTFENATPAHVEHALQRVRQASVSWAQTPWQDRAAIFLRAADLLAGSYRQVLNAATMACQSKTAFQAEIDAACELIDFIRFNVHFMEQIYRSQPLSPPGVWNRTEYRPLEGFVFAVTPFNFTAIAANLPLSAALMGNVVLWKPASTAVYSGHFVQELWRRAGLPDGVIEMLPGAASEMAPTILSQPDLAGIHFTGSTEVFGSIWKTVGNQIGRYRTYPRIVGETGGKDFVLMHASADLDEAATALVRGAFEYQGQKCSAASRAYIPASCWEGVRERMVAQVNQIRIGDVSDFRNFMSAVIDKTAFERIKGYIDLAKSSRDASMVYEGVCDDSEGYFIGPHIIETTNPKHRLMCEEIFGPVLTIYVYDDARFDDVLTLVDETSPYALTGSILARDRAIINQATRALTHAAGNFYINDKPTGAVVGQQPFGGGRASGTNDKAGSALNLLRWTSPRSIKETLTPPKHFGYPFLLEG